MQERLRVLTRTPHRNLYFYLNVYRIVYLVCKPTRQLMASRCLAPRYGNEEIGGTQAGTSCDKVTK